MHHTAGQCKFHQSCNVLNDFRLAANRIHSSKEKIYPLDPLGCFEYHWEREEINHQSDQQKLVRN